MTSIAWYRKFGRNRKAKSGIRPGSLMCPLVRIFAIRDMAPGARLVAAGTAGTRKAVTGSTAHVANPAMKRR